MKDKTSLSMEEISRRIKEVELPDFDLVVGLATGGVVPSSLLAFKYSKPLQTIKLNYRDEFNIPRSDEPVILSENIPLFKNKTILLVDDVSVSGKTLEKAKSLLHGNRIITLVLKGKGDIVLFPEIDKCVIWPWKNEN